MPAVLSWLDENLSRKGFLAKAGTALAGAAAAGLTRVSVAAAATCPCPTNFCNNCPSTGGCPSRCSQTGFHNCCVSGRIQNCWRCSCGGHGCHCSRITGALC